MKKILYIVLAALSVSLAGCSGFLVEENLASTTSDAYYRTPAGHQASLNVVYSWLHDIYDSPAPYLAGTDLYIVYNGRAKPEQALSQYSTLSAGHSVIGDLYENLYKGISAANTTLYYADLVDDYAALPRVVAEARFLRAFYYMQLVQQFGGTPLALEMYDSPVYELERSTDVDIWNFVITEMEAARPDLMPRFNASTWGRVDQRACNHFLALACLSRGWKTGTQADFTQARTYADAAIGGMALIPDYSTAYATGVKGRDFNWRNDEVIWSVTYHQGAMEDPTDGTNQGELFGGYFNGAPQENKQQGGTYVPTQYFFWLNTKDIADPNNDSRWDATFEMVVFNTSFAPHEKTAAELKSDTNVNGVWIPWWKPEYTRWATREAFALDYPGTLKDYPGDPGFTVGFAKKSGDGKYQNGRFRHIPSAGIDFTTATQAQLNFANQLILRDQSAEQAAGISPLAAVNDVNFLTTNCVKFESYPSQRRDRNDVSQRDVDVARLAETYLIAAEACVKLNLPGDAAGYINTVRRRAIAASDAKRELAAADVTIERILDERARELFGMYNRWYDLSRTGTLVDHAVRYNPDLEGLATNFVGPDGQQKLLRPIPQAAIDANRAGIQQNPGY
jgi:hypothetical protein